MFTKLKIKETGLRVRIDLSKVSLIQELEENQGTNILLDNGLNIVVEESFQTVSNRTAQKADAEPVTGL